MRKIDNNYLGNTKIFNTVLKEKYAHLYDFITGLLNSNVLNYFEKQISTPKAGGAYEHKTQFIERYPILTILFMRFAWGLRTVLPISIGIRAYPFWKYVLINLVACFIWAVIVVTFGFQISHYLHLFWTKILSYHQDIYIVIAVILCILLFRVFYIVLKWWRKYHQHS